MSNVSGVVTNVTYNSLMSKNTGKPFKVYSIEVNGAWYECGFKAPCAVGQSVTFEYSLNYGKNKITDGTLSVGSATFGAAMAGAAPISPRASAPQTTAATGKTFPVPKNSPERSIIRQNAMTQAREILADSGSLAGLLKEATPTAVGEVFVPTDEQLDVVAAVVISLAMRFEAYACGEYAADLSDKATSHLPGKMTV